MSESPRHNAAAHFEALFSADPDPWSYRTKFAELRRHDLLIAMLELPMYRRTFEPACASGMLTALLARRSEEVIAWDGSANAVAHARNSMNDLPNVQVARNSVPSSWPDGTFDLIVLSDFLYYLPVEEIQAVAESSRLSLEDGGLIIACHWRGIAHDFLTPGGDAVHRVLTDTLGRATGPRYSDARQRITGWQG